MTGLSTIVKREFLANFYAPIAYVVGVAFLALNGFSFWALMRTLSDPTAPAPLGAVLRSFFGGTLMHWFTVFALIAVLSMRSVAEDRRTGIWEAMLTTRVSAGTILVGKWLALLAFYVLLWMPSIFLIIVFSWYLPEGQALDLGPVVSSYLGVLGTGASLLAIGVAVSTTTENQVVAAVGSFSLYLGWLMLGEYGHVADLEGGSWIFFTNLRESLRAMASGEVELLFFWNHLAVTVLALSIATAVAARDRRAGLRQILAVLLFVISGASGGHMLRVLESFDWSESRANSLEPSTLALLAEVGAEVRVTVIRPREQVFDPVHQQVMRLLRRMQGAQEQLSIVELDPLAKPQKVQAWAFELAIRPEDLATGGGVIIAQGSRQRVVDLLGMASFASDDLGVGALSEFRAEAAFAQGLREVMAKRQERLCISQGHGEFLMKSSEEDANWKAVAERLVADGIELAPVLELSSQSLHRCDGLVVFGASQNFSSDERLVLHGFLEGGGDLLLALRSWPEAGNTVPGGPGLPLLLEERGMRVLDARVVDPEAELELKPAWMTYSGYGSHPIVANFQERRATVWHAPFALAPLNETVTVLVRASEQGWAETNVEGLYTGDYNRDEADHLELAVALAHADEQGSRLVLFGSAESLSSIWSKRGIGGNDRLLLSACLWILDRHQVAPAQSKRPEYLRLLMSASQLRQAFLWCVVAGPGGFAFIGALLWWWRRRED